MSLDILDIKGHQPASNSSVLMSEKKVIFYPVLLYRLISLQVWETYVCIGLERLLYNLLMGG